MEHILEVIFALQKNSPLHKALEENMYVMPEDFIMEMDETLEDLMYKDDSGTLVKIPKHGAGLLKTFKWYIAYLSMQGQIIEEKEWVNLTYLNFNLFRTLNASNINPITPMTVPSSNTHLPPVIDLVKEFKCGIKCNASQFLSLKDNTT